MAQQTPHSTDNYSILKGVLSIATYNTTTGVVSAYSDMGNAPSAEVEPSIERLPHYSSREGLRIKDKNPVISTEYSVRFSLDELAAVNIQKYLMGTLADPDTVYALNATDEEYALRFTENNPMGPNKVWNMWRVTLSPAGPIQLIGDGTAWAVMEMQAEGLSDLINHPESPYITVTYADGAPSVTTTATETGTT
jgi:hypothetical protein